MNEDLGEKIKSIFNEVFAAQTGSEEVPELNADTVLLDTGLDSLGFAVLVVRLEVELDYDPFVLSTEAYYPVTFGDFVSFYEANAPK